MRPNAPMQMPLYLPYVASGNRAPEDRQQFTCPSAPAIANGDSTFVEDVENFRGHMEA